MALALSGWVMMVSTNAELWVGLREAGSGANRKGIGQGVEAGNAGNQDFCLPCLP